MPSKSWRAGLVCRLAAPLDGATKEAYVTLFDSPLPDHAIEAIDCLVQEAKTPRKSGGKAAGEDHGALEPLTAV